MNENKEITFRVVNRPHHRHDLDMILGYFFVWHSVWIWMAKSFYINISIIFKSEPAPTEIGTIKTPHFSIAFHCSLYLDTASCFICFWTGGIGILWYCLTFYFTNVATVEVLIGSCRHAEMRPKPWLVPTRLTYRAVPTGVRAGSAQPMGPAWLGRGPCRARLPQAFDIGKPIDAPMSELMIDFFFYHR